MCVLVYARTHTQNTWALDVSPGMDGHLESQKNPDRLKRGTFRPYRCTQYICLYVCWAAGFDDLV